jgi:DedD protein
MDEKSELSDIVLKKGDESGGSKKIILAIATLGVILIVVIMLMNSLSSNSGDNLPKAILPPVPTMTSNQITNEDPLFEEVEIVQEDSISDNSLTEITQKLKQESIEEKDQIVETKKIKKPEKIIKQVVTKKPNIKNSKTFYVQVGSFSKYAPDKKFLDTIITKGYKYKFHKVNKLNKVLIGPFKIENEARKALMIIRKDIEAGAFLTNKYK